MAEIMVGFGEAVHRVRRRKGWRQLDLARAAGIDQSHISGIERGIVDPGLRTAKRIATALGVPLAELVAEAEGGPGRTPDPPGWE